MDFQTASGQEVFCRGSGFGFELQPEVYRLPGQVSLVPKPPALRPNFVTRYVGRVAWVDRSPARERPWGPLNQRSLLMAKRHRLSEQSSVPNPIAIISGILSLGVIRSINRAKMKAAKTSGLAVQGSYEVRSAIRTQRSTAR
jgi:hypothetical protein